MKHTMQILGALFFSTFMLAKTSATVELLAEFHRLEESHKLDWLDFMGKNSTAKTLLIKNQKKDWVNFGIAQDRALAELTEFSEPTKNAYFNNKLRSAIVLHEKHVAAWERWATSKNEQARKLADKHKAELETFKRKLK